MGRPLVVLVYTRTGWDIKNVTSLLPLALLYLVRPLKQAGFDVMLIDQRLDRDWETSLRRAVPNALFVGITAMTGAQIGWGLRAATVVREHAPRTPIVWGGIHPSLLPAQTAAHALVDIVVRGEGEETVVELARALANGRDLGEVAGLTFVRNGVTVETPERPMIGDLDQILIPDYESISVEDYITTQTLGLRDLAIITSRGCPNACRYCYNLPYSKRRWRPQSAEAVVEHIRWLNKRFGIEGILIKDDNFYVSRKRVEAIAEGLNRADVRVTIRGECRADYIASHWDEGFLRFLYQSGFREMTVGAESGDDTQLRGLRKDINVDEILEANQRLRRAGIAVKFTFMAGFPSEDAAAVRRTVQLMLKIIDTNPIARVTPLHLYAPYPGTPLFEDAVARGYRPPAALADWAAVSFHKLDLPWIAPGPSRRLERASLATYFLDRQTVAEYFTGRPLVQMMARTYGRAIRWRCRRMFFHMMPEMGLVDWFRRRAQ
jgi:anaerobic magnesium-protoporphyrin IX monomethyl ester cyclase